MFKIVSKWIKLAMNCSKICKTFEERANDFKIA